MDSEIIRWLKDGSRLILTPTNKKILYPHIIIHKKGATRNGYMDVIKVGATINPLSPLKNINGCDINGYIS